jgi:hypothetical protein
MATAANTRRQLPREGGRASSTHLSPPPPPPYPRIAKQMGHISRNRHQTRRFYVDVKSVALFLIKNIPLMPEGYLPDTHQSIMGEKQWYAFRKM